jgi:hypothetical protein
MLHSRKERSKTKTINAMKKFQIIEEGRNLKQTELNHIQGGANEQPNLCPIPSEYTMCAVGGLHDTPCPTHCPSYCPTYVFTCAPGIGESYAGDSGTCENYQ